METPGERRQLGRPGRSFENNVKKRTPRNIICLWNVSNWLRIGARGLFLLVPKHSKEFLTSLERIIFSLKTPLHEVNYFVSEI